MEKSQSEATGNHLFYGQIVQLQNVYLLDRLLSGARGGGNDGVVTKRVEREGNIIGTYQWTVMQQEENAGAGPVNYGDSVFLKCNFVDNRWLTGCRDSENKEVYTRDVTREPFDKRRTYSWTVMRDANDTGAGPVNYGDTVFLKCNFMDYRWLTGARGGDNEGVGTNDVTSEASRVRPTYQWIVQP